ncbi:MAG: EAL domain-containing protein, partial [Pseudoxanthomonas sp.]
AEGVETREQLQFLQDEHCDHAQGYYIAHPMPAAELLKIFLIHGKGPSPDLEYRQPSLFTRGQASLRGSVH